MSVCSCCPYNIEEDGILCCEYPDPHGCCYEDDDDVAEELDLDEWLALGDGGDLHPKF